MIETVPTAWIDPVSKPEPASAHLERRDPAEITRKQVAKLLSTGRSFTMTDLQDLTAESAAGVLAAIDALTDDGLVISCRRVRVFKLIAEGEET